MVARRQCNNIFKIMKEKQMKNLSAMNLQPEKSFPRKEGEVKRFPDNLKFLLDLSSRNINGNLSG